MEKSESFWVTRDEDAAGVLSDMVDIWLARPHRLNLSGGGSYWLGPGITGLEERYAQWSLEVCRKNCGTLPDTSRECLMVGDGK